MLNEKREKNIRDISGGTPGGFLNIKKIDILLMTCE
jgi:hypothetical protein